jgi:hypothetical protein
MANIKTVRFGNADNSARKGFVRAFDKMVHDLMSHKRSGDCIEIEMDDGTVQHYRFAGPGDQSHPAKQSHTKMPNDEGLEFHVMPGKEP